MIGANIDETILPGVILEGEWIYYNEDDTGEWLGTYKNGELVSGYDMKELIEYNF